MYFEVYAIDKHHWQTRGTVYSRGLYTQHGIGGMHVFDKGAALTVFVLSTRSTSERLSSQRPVLLYITCDPVAGWIFVSIAAGLSLFVCRTPTLADITTIVILLQVTKLAYLRPD